MNITNINEAEDEARTNANAAKALRKVGQWLEFGGEINRTAVPNTIDSEFASVDEDGHLDMWEESVTNIKENMATNAKKTINSITMRDDIARDLIDDNRSIVRTKFGKTVFPEIIQKLTHDEKIAMNQFVIQIKHLLDKSIHEEQKGREE